MPPVFICTMNISQLRVHITNPLGTITYRSVEDQWAINLKL